MLFYFVNNTDRTDDIVMNTLQIRNQIQQRSDSCSFKIWNGTKPSENQDIKIYDGGLVNSHSGTQIILQDSYEADINAFRAGQVLWLDIGTVNLEKAIVSSYVESTKTITLTASPTGSLTSGDKIGELIYGGVVARVQDENIHSLSNIEYQVTGVDYTKIFDKKIISDTWEDVDSRYIINSFVNSTVNHNTTIDDIDYADNTAIQAEWIESGDGNNPTIDSADFLEGDASGVFSWTNSGGTATFSATPTSKDLSEFFGVSSGTPTKGLLMSWFKTSNQSVITSIKVRIGSDSSNYAEFTISLPSSTTTDWQYTSTKATSATITGTPVWTATDYAALRVTETGNGTVRWNGLRVNANDSFTLFNVQSTPSFTDFRSPQLKPTKLINQIAKQWEYIWYIDYERDIRFVEKENDPSPFNLSDTSNNFIDLKVEVDVSNLGNRVIVRGGEKTSASTYAQVFEGDGVLREWVLKNKFKNLVITIDNNGSTDLMEAGTTTTTVKATAHGLSVGNHIVNRTRSNAVRQVLTVPDVDTFTVEAVTSQASGDTFSLFSVSKTDGIEGLTDETTVNYVANSNEKSVRAVSTEATLTSGIFIRFAYNERLPIQIQYTDSASANALKALGVGDGIFDLDPITDRNIQDTNTALSLAEAKLREFSNAVVTGTFKTDQKGLRAGQLIHVTESTKRSIDDDYIIQMVTKKQLEGRFKDYMEITVIFGTTLFGWIEFMQKLLSTQDRIELNVDDIVETYATSDEIVETSETNQVAKDGGFKTATGDEVMETPETNQVVDFTPPWKWEANGVSQPLNTRWNLFSWS